MAARKMQKNGVDLPLLVAVIALCVFGLIMVYSASWDYALRVDGNAFLYLNKQMLFMAAGAVVILILSRFDYHRFQPLAVPLAGATVLLLVAVLFIGMATNGATRNLIGRSVQPSELAKLAIIIYLSVWLYSRREQLHDIMMGLVPLGSILGIVCVLIILQTDLSAAITIFLLGGLLFFLAGGEMRQIIIFGLAAAVTIFLIIQVFGIGQLRWGMFTGGLENPLQSPDQVYRALEAIQNGGIFGVGIGRSIAKLVGLQNAFNDSIFAVIVEETGWIGAFLLIGLFGVILWRGVRIALNAPDLMGSVLAGGITFWLTAEAAMNMAMIIGLMPVTGNNLPFISAGGSNLLVCLAGIGILLNISRQRGGAGSPALSGGERNIYGASVDWRRRNGRRSVSGPYRPAGS